MKAKHVLLSLKLALESLAVILFPVLAVEFLLSYYYRHYILQISFQGPMLADLP